MQNPRKNQKTKKHKKTKFSDPTPLTIWPYGGRLGPGFSFFWFFGFFGFCDGFASGCLRAPSAEDGLARLREWTARAERASEA